MARAELPIVALNTTTGLPVSGASVQVKFRSSGLNATWWTQESGGTSSTAAITTDAAGRTSAWFDRGAYNCVVSGTGITTYTEPWDSSPASDGAIDALWLPDNVIANRHLADNAVNTSELTDAAVTAAKLNTTAKQLFPQLASASTKTINFGVSAALSFGISTIAETTVSHGLASAPSYVFALPTSGTNTTDMVSVTAKAITATQITFRAISHVGTLNLPGIVVYWLAIV